MKNKINSSKKSEKEFFKILLKTKLNYRQFDAFNLN